MMGAKVLAPAAQLCVFDTRRGQREGNEAEKILFFFPDYTPINEQLALVGLSEGLVAFTRIFSPHAPCETMDAEKHRHLFYECEPDIWMILVVEKGGQTGLEETLRDEALQAVLQEAHSLFRLFFGSISTLLAAEAPSSDAAKRCLSTFLLDYLSGGTSGKRWKVPTLAESLTERGTVQRLQVDRQTFLVVQAIVGFLQTSLGEAAGLDCFLLFQNLVVASTLSPEDTAILFAYANLRLIPSLLPSASAATSQRLPFLPHAPSSPVVATDSLYSQTATSFWFSSSYSQVSSRTPARKPSFGRSKIGSLFQNASGKNLASGPDTSPNLAPNSNPAAVSRLSPVLALRGKQKAGSSATASPQHLQNSSAGIAPSTAQAQATDPQTNKGPSPTSLSSAPSPDSDQSEDSSPSSSSSARPRPSLPKVASSPPSPLQSDTWRKTQEGFLASTAWGVENGRPVVPTVYLQNSGDATGAEVHEGGWRELAFFVHKGLTLGTLSKAEGGGAGAALEAVEKVRSRLEALEQVLAQEWGGPTAAHIQGHRYICVNRGTRVVRASPPVKVTTLSKDSLLLLNQIRAEVDSERRRESARCPRAPAEPAEPRYTALGQDNVQNGRAEKEDRWHDVLAGEGEVCARGHNGTWVMARRTLGLDFYTAMERASETLLLASEAVEQMSARHFSGAFPSD